MNRNLLPMTALLVACGCADSHPTAPAPTARQDSRLSVMSSGRRCHPVQGGIREIVVGPDTADGTISGDVSGTVGIKIVSLNQLPSGVVQFQARCTYHTSEGTFTTLDNADLSPIEPPLYRVNNRLDVTGGTEGFAGATGNLHTHGTVNFVYGGLVDLHYVGEMCTEQ